MKRVKSLERYFYALDYEKQIKTNLTKKQFLVYTFLLSKSLWDAQSSEEHYYVYKNSFVIKDATKKLGISQPTWRSAIKKLIDEKLVKEKDRYYEIYFPKTYAPLNIKLISFLLDFSIYINNSGNIVGVYSTLYKYWELTYKNNKKCCISINQLLKLFEINHTAQSGKYYEILLAIFETQGLMTIKKNARKYKGQNYIEYEILFMNHQLPKNIEEQNYGPDDIKDIITALENSFE
jgi:hypothetical protein